MAGLDRYNRYLVVPPEGGKPVPHSRVTTVVKELEDEYGLQRWRERQLAIGLAKRNDLLAGAAAAREDKGLLDALCEQAKEAAGASSSANIGSAVHKFCEQLDRDEIDLGDVPEPWCRDVRAYRETLAQNGYSVELVEQVVVLPDYTIAGTLDRVLRRGEERFVGDLKTGSLEYGWPAMAAQLAAYSHAETIFSDDDTHRPMVPVSRELGIIVHLPAGKATCELIQVDLVTGWLGVELAYAVREHRKRGFRVAADTERREWLRRRVRRLIDDYPEAATLREDDFLNGQRIDPATDGRPDPRPDVRENEKVLGNLVNDFDFDQSPRAPVVLAVHPKTTLTGTPKPSQLSAAQKAGDADG